MNCDILECGIFTTTNSVWLASNYWIKTSFYGDINAIKVEHIVCYQIKA